MNIALVSAGFKPRHYRLQPHRTLLEMGRQLSLQGHVVTLISDGVARWPAQDEVMGMPLRRVSSVQIFRGRHNTELFAALDATAPDLVLWHLGLTSLIHQELHHPFAQDTIAILTSPVQPPRDILRLGPMKWSSNLDLVAAYFAGAFVPAALIRRTFGNGGLRGAITLSEATRRHLIAREAGAERVWVVPPGVDAAWFDAGGANGSARRVREALGLQPDDFVVTYFGSPAPVRGLYTAMLAVKLVARIHPQLKLLILARRLPDEWERESERLHRFIEQNDLHAQVRVVERFMERQTLIEHVQAGDVVCLPFELVPSDVPLSILESMALERAVITTNVGCIPELIGSDRGFLIPPGSVPALARQLETLIATPGLAKACGQRARAYVQEHRTWAGMGAALQRVVENAYAE